MCVRAQTPAIRIERPERMAYVLYGVCVLAFLLRFRVKILQHDYLLLALALFALSVTLDLLQPEGIDIFLVEDGAKMTGILSWTAFFLATLLRRLAQPCGVDPLRQSPYRPTFRLHHGTETTP